MDTNSNKGIYPSSPLESSIVGKEQQQKLLTPAPPSYAQTMGATPVQTAPTVVLVNEPPTVPYGPHPVDITCPFCHNQARTRLRFRANTKTHLIAALLCIFQLYCCVCLPYCINSCLSTQHYCGMCDRYLGTYASS